MENDRFKLMHLSKKNDYNSEKDYKTFIKQKEILDKLIAGKNNEIKTLNNKIKYDYLTYYFKTEINPISFNDFNRLLGLKKRQRMVLLRKYILNRIFFVSSKRNY